MRDFSRSLAHPFYFCESRDKILLFKKVYKMSKKNLVFYG